MRQAELSQVSGADWSTLQKARKPSQRPLQTEVTKVDLSEIPEVFEAIDTNGSDDLKRQE